MKNVCLNMYFLNKKLFREILPLFIESFESADYVVQPVGGTNFYPFNISVNLIVDPKKEFTVFLLDFDNILVSDDVISVRSLNIDLMDNSLHYWAFTGAIVKSFADVSPAFFAGYFMEKSYKIEQQLFNAASPIVKILNFHQI